VCVRVFLFSHSRPPSLLYDPNMLVCVLGFVFCSVCVSGCVWRVFNVAFNVVKSDLLRNSRALRSIDYPEIQS